MGMKKGFGDLLFPKVDPESPFTSTEYHLAEGDLLLMVVLDVAERGGEGAGDAGHHEEADRFNIIIRLLNLYRAGNDAFTEKLAKLGKAEAA